MKKTKIINPFPGDSVYDEVSSPIGKLTLIASSAGLHAIQWDSDREKPADLCLSKNQKIIEQTKKQLEEYFQGRRKIFDLPLAVTGTDFQIEAWKELSKIPYAATITYAEQATRIGNKNKARAVGLANGLNPIPIIIPCHRVIGSNGNLVGFAGGLDKKTYLLNLEKNTTSLN